MSNAVKDYPGLAEALNQAATSTDVESRKVGGLTYLRVTQTFREGEGEQFLFRMDGEERTLLAVDNAVAFPDPNFRAGLGYSGTMSDADHAAVAAVAIASVDVFKTRDGPGHGSVACMWAARHVVYNTVKQWITQSDGTATFYSELQKGGIKPVGADTLPNGATIISPTTPKAIGHIGLLGNGVGPGRLVYSNHSPSHADPVARWEQNYTVGSFTKYHTDHGLETLFYRLPKPGGM